LQLVIICCLQHKEIGSLFGVCRELRATVRCRLPNLQPGSSSPLSCPEVCESVRAAKASTEMRGPMCHILATACCVPMLQMRTAMLTHFNLQTPHHEDARLRTPAPPRAKRVMLAQPSCRAAFGSASTADSMYASIFKQCRTLRPQRSAGFSSSHCIAA